MIKTVPSPFQKTQARVQSCASRWRLAAALVALLFLTRLCAAADTLDSKVEYKVKAGYLFNFVKFVEWPTDASNTNAPFRIGIVDEGDAYPVMESILQGKSAVGRPLEIHRAQKGEDLKSYQIIFITRSAEKQVRDILNSLGDAPVLTVGEMDQFAQSGGKINFAVKGENIRLEINLAAANAARLKVSSRLASLGTIIHSEK